MRTLIIAASTIALFSTAAQAQNCRFGDAGYCMNDHRINDAPVNDMQALVDMRHMDKSIEAISQRKVGEPSYLQQFKISLEIDKVEQERVEQDRDASDLKNGVKDVVLKEKIQKQAEEALESASPATKWLIASMKAAEKEMAERNDASHRQSTFDRSKLSAHALTHSEEDQRGYPCSGSKVPSQVNPK